MYAESRLNAAFSSHSLTLLNKSIHNIIYKVFIHPLFLGNAGGTSKQPSPSEAEQQTRRMEEIGMGVILEVPRPRTGGAASILRVHCSRVHEIRIS